MLNEEIRNQIINNYDPDLIVEVLEITTEQLVDVFEDLLEENVHKFIEEDEDEVNN